MTSLREVPLSGDKLVDWIFKQFIFFIRKETLSIKRKKRLLYKFKNNEHYKAIRGLMDSDKEPKIEITINPSKSWHATRKLEVKTLIHELSHVVFCKTGEPFIEQIEEILNQKFTKEQKSFLRSFIPRHEVKK